MLNGPAGEEEGYEGYASSAELSPARIDRPLVEQLVRGVTAHKAELDEQLKALSQNWRIERMAIVERNVIRVALFELKYCPDVPYNVVLNEAVELAKRYGTAEGAAFANGMLDRAVGAARQCGVAAPTVVRVPGAISEAGYASVSPCPAASRNAA